MKTVMETYPPTHYPKLYSGSIGRYKKTQKFYRSFNKVIFTIGFSLLSAIIMWDYTTEGQISPLIPWAYFMVQMIPIVWLEIKEYKSFKAMRINNTNPKKSATIMPRKLFDFISPKLLGFAIIVLLISFSLVIVKYGFSGKSFQNIAIILAANAFFAGVAYWSIYGTKQDPYQTNDDRTKVLTATIKSMIYVSIGVSVFLSIQMLIKIYDLPFLKTIAMSIYCQLILWASIGNRLKEIKLEDIDFSVYKKEAEELTDKSNKELLNKT
jgi:hypothetical protein